MLNTTFLSFGPRGQTDCKAVLSDTHNATKSYDISFYNLCSTDPWIGKQIDNKNNTVIPLIPKISEITKNG